MAIPLHVLIVEDSENDAELMLLHLRKGDFEVTHTRVETAEAMRAALQQHAWDMVISDYNLPNFSAPAALSILQESGLDIPLIIASGTITEETAINLMRAGAADYLMKDRLARLAPLAKRELNITRVRRERKEARAVLLETETLFHTLFEQSPFGVLILDSETTLPLEFNAAVHQQLGYTRQEFARLRISDYEAIEKPEETHVHTQKVLVESWDQFETLHRTKKGEIRNVHVSAQLLELSGRQVFHCIYHDITERKQAETQREAAREALKAASLYSRKLIETSLDPMVTISAEGEITDVNTATEKITGMSREKLLGSDFADYFTEPKMARAGYRKAFEQGQVVDYPLSLRHTSGSITEVLYNASVYRDEQGEVVGIFAVARDISERKRAEEALRESEAGLAEAQRISQVGSWVWDLVTNTTTWSPEMYRIFGLSPDTYDGKPETLLKMVHPDDREHFDRIMEANLTRGETRPLEYRIIRPDGVERQVSARGVIVHDAAGKPVKNIGTVQDITERKQAERSLVESEQKYRLLHESAGVAIGYYTPQGVVISFNRKAADNMNGNPQDFTGKSIYDLFPKASADVYFNRIKKAIDSESPQFYEDKVNLPSGDLWFDSTFMRILDSNGRAIGVQIISSDITERKQTEARINAQMDELRRWQNITLGREDRILQLKGEVNRLLTEAGKPPRYASAVEPVDE